MEWYSHAVLEEGKHIFWYLVPKAGEEAAKGMDSINTVWDTILLQEQQKLLMGGWSYSFHLHCLMKSALLP